MSGKRSGAQLKVVAASSAAVAPTPRQRRRERVVTGVVAQVREALKPRNRLATVLGFLLGGLVPVACYVLAHQEIDRAASLFTQLTAYLVLGGLLYSARTVYEWGARAFHSGAKAFGFVVLLEGVMIASSTSWLGFAALAYLIAINGVATGCNLALARERHTND